MRQVVLDTETTGLEPSQGHRIIEIGCVEVVDRKLTGNHYHQYINPQREVESSAIEVHGITNEFLEDKPVFKDIFAEFLAFIDGAELVIHNAAFDIGFINHEFALLQGGPGKVEKYCGVLDTLAMARKKHPGQRNSLDALCKRYGIDNSMRDLHGALLDSEILADVYLLMTGGQTMLSLSGDDGSDKPTAVQRLPSGRPALTVLKASEQELAAHENRLDALDKKSDGAIWRAP